MQVEAEVLRLEQLKASKMKELVLKKKSELEEHRRRAHLVGDDGYAAQFSIEAIEAGKIMLIIFFLAFLSLHVGRIKFQSFCNVA